MNSKLAKSLEKVAKLIGDEMINVYISPSLDVSKFSDVEIEDIKSSIIHFAGLKKPIFFEIRPSDGKNFLWATLNGENKLKVEKQDKKMYSFTGSRIQKLQRDILKNDEDLLNGTGYIEKVEDLFSEFYSDALLEKKEKKHKDVYVVTRCGAFEAVYGSQEDALAHCTNVYYARKNPILLGEGKLTVSESKILEETKLEIQRREVVVYPKKKRDDKRSPKKERLFTVKNFSQYIEDWKSTQITIDMLWQKDFHVVDVYTVSMGGDEYKALDDSISDYVKKRLLEYPRFQEPNVNVEKLMVKFAREMFEKKLLKKLGDRIIFMTDIGDT